MSNSRILGLGLWVAAMLPSCANQHENCGVGDFCVAYSAKIHFSVNDAATGGDVAGVTVVVDGQPIADSPPAMCGKESCLSCDNSSPTEPTWCELELLSSSHDSAQTYDIVISAPGYSSSEASVTADYPNYYCTSSSCPAPLSMDEFTVTLQQI